jgi:hypothetical protein
VADLFRRGAFRNSLPSLSWQAADELLSVAKTTDCLALQNDELFVTVLEKYLDAVSAVSTLALITAPSS